MIHTGSIIYALVLATIAVTGATESGIVGGRVAKPHSKPYMVSLQIDDHHTCGGVLIRMDFVLTAAHCKYQDNMTVVLGAHNISHNEKTQQRIEVAKYFKYPNYTGGMDYDIMLIKLKTKAKLNQYVKAIDLPKKYKNIPAEVQCEVAGWGKTGPTESTSKVLKEATERIQSSPECKKVWREYFSESRMICTTFTKKGGGICQGDSGGPLICNDKVEGIADFTAANECDNPDYPHVFVKVRYYLPWIKKMMKK